MTTLPARRTRAPFALLAGSGIVAATLLLAPAAQAADEPTARTSASYLAAQLEAGGDRLTVTYGEDTFDDLGLTIDAVLALESTKTADAQAGRSTQYVLDHAGSYTGTSYGDLYVGAAGKLLVLTASRDLPGTVGGTDYVAALQAQEQSSGRYTDKSGYGDYSNTLGQSFALIGLKRHGVNPSTAAVDFLLSRQCDDGGFALEGDGACVSDPDATSVAVQALSTVGGQDAAIQDAADYLEGRQGTDGGLGGGATTEGENSNSTGLGAVALRLAGRDDALTAARGYLDSVRLGCATPKVTGGLAYTVAEHDAATAATTPTDRINRSTAQGLLGSTDVSYGDVSNEGAAADADELTCSDSSGTPTSDPTTPTSEPTTATVTDEPSSSPSPERPEVVQTDGTGTDAGTTALAAVTLVGLTAAAATAAARGPRRRGQHR